FAESLGRPKDAIALWQSILREHPDDFVGSETTWMYAYRSMDRLLAGSGRKLYAPFEAEAEELYQQGLQGDGTAALARVLEEYPNSKRVSDAYLEISRRHVARGQHAEAVRAIHDY